MDEKDENAHRQNLAELRRATEELAYRSGYIRERTAEVTARVRYALANVRDMLDCPSDPMRNALEEEEDYEEQLLEFEHWRKG